MSLSSTIHHQDPFIHPFYKKFLINNVVQLFLSFPSLHSTSLIELKCSGTLHSTLAHYTICYHINLQSFPRLSLSRTAACQPTHQLKREAGLLFNIATRRKRIFFVFHFIYSALFIIIISNQSLAVCETAATQQPQGFKNPVTHCHSI